VSGANIVEEGAMASDDRKQGDVSRRDFIKGTLAGAAAAAGGALVGSADAAMVEAASTLPAARGCSRDDELVFYNGKIRTMDSHNRVVSEVAIRDGASWKSATSAGADPTPSICAGRS
jgi:anaerobic selenocysteine-containing dehydrogenase